MSTINTLRLAIKAAITAIPALASVKIVDAVLPEHVDGLAIQGDCIALIYMGRGPKGTSILGSRTSDASVYRWNIAIVTSNWQTPTGAMTKTLGIEDIAEALLGPPGGEAGLRVANLATINGDIVSLRFVSEIVRAPQDRPERGGPAALMQEWETFPEVLL